MPDQSRLAQFANQKYLNFESYRKNGQPVATPMWFAEDGGVFYVYTLANAGKVKRVRNNPQVRVMPCDVRGNPRGEWAKATARITSGAEAARGHQLLDRKYGLLKQVGNLFSKLLNRQRVVMAIQIDE
jgi:hypothetical protein